MKPPTRHSPQKFICLPVQIFERLGGERRAIDRRRRFIGNTLATPMNPNKKPQGRGQREGAVSLEAGDQ